MSRTAYVLRRPEGGPFNVNCYASFDGFTTMGYDVRLFLAEEVDALPLGRDCVVHATIGVVKSALRRIGAPVPPPLTVPESVRPFLGRRQWETTMGEIRTLRDAPVFVKPLHDGKTFTGNVVRTFRDLLYTVNMDDDYPVLAQEVVALASEWRAYVLRGELLGLGNYKGEPLSFPDPAVVRAFLAAIVPSPTVAYAADFGVTEDGRTLLVEMNDAYALGNYGLPPVKYARMIEARWDEMAAAAAESEEGA